jgi:opacity protein-like surface antigen
MSLPAEFWCQCGVGQFTFSRAAITRPSAGIAAFPTRLHACSITCVTQRQRVTCRDVGRPRRRFFSVLERSHLCLEEHVRIQTLKALVLSCVLVVVAAAPVAAQEGFTAGHTDVGPTIGLGGIGGAGLAVGGRFEKGVKALPDLNDGVLGIGVALDWYSYDNSLFGSDYGFTYMPISVTANYHFGLENKKLDPFIGAGLGYLRVSFDCGQYSFCDGVSSSGIYFVGHAGVRYFMKPAMALYADVGAGAATLNVGLMFKLK